MSYSLLMSRAIRNDYDDDPDRFIGGAKLFEQHWLVEDVHGMIADRLLANGAAPVLDVGCGNGRLITQLAKREIEFVGLDQSPTMLAEIDGPTRLGDATDLPFPDGSFGAVTALYMLYHIPDPVLAISEAHRVLRDGGLFAAATPSRFDEPELRKYLPSGSPSTFDAEIGPDMIESVFGNVEVDAWDMPGVRLPDTAAVARYLYHHNAIQPERADELAQDVPAPITLTKRGALIWASKSGG